MINQMEKSITVAEAIVNSLVKERIEHVFCVPGESYLPILDALHDEPSVQVISTRHEGGAAFMAEAYGKCMLKPSVVLATRGVGASNLAIGVHTAYQDSTPMIVLLGQVHRKFLGKEGFQEVDLEQFFGPITKWAIEVHDPTRIHEIMTKAIRISVTGRPGPVVISLPEDILPQQVEPTIYHQLIRPTPKPSKNELNIIMKALQNAKSPLVIAGGGIKSANAENELVLFSEQFNLPVLVAFRRHDVFPHQHRHFIGHLGLGESNHINQAIERADVIIAIGTRLSEVTTKDYSIIKPHHRLIHIDIDYTVLGKAFEPFIGIVADAKEMLLCMQKLEIKSQWNEWTARLRSEYEKERLTNLSEAKSLNTSIIEHIEQALPKEVIITNDAGNFASWLHEFFTFQRPHSYVGPTSGAMGYGLPAAIGAKLAYPQKTVVTLAGDGGFMMTVQELETAVRYHIPIICLVFNNNMYGTIRMHQEMHYPERVIGTDLGYVSFSELAKSVGAEGVTVKTLNQFKEAFQKALQNDIVTVIEIVTDPEQISVHRTIEAIRNSK